MDNKRNRQGGGTAVQDAPAPGPVAVETPAAAPTTNFVLMYRREHPGNRCSYGIAGVPGIVVFDRGLFANPAFTGNITLDCPLALPKGDGKAAKAEAAAAKAAERATKAQAKIEAAAAKAIERQAKADAALAAAKKKVEEANALKAKSATPATATA